MTEYSSQYRYEDDDPRDLDWTSPPGDSVEQDAAIIQEAWGQTRLDDEDDIREALSDIPREFHEPIRQAIMETAGIQGKFQEEFQEEFQEGARLEWEQELTQPAMRYLEDIGREDLAHRLEGVLRDNRTMEAVRELPGDPLMYGSDVREKYIQAVADIPAAIHGPRRTCPGTPGGLRKSRQPQLTRSTGWDTG